MHGCNYLKGLVLATSLLIAGLAQAQVSNVNASINIIQGEPYYIHTVLQGQQMWQIARAYFTKVAVIRENNPGQRDPLVEGTKLKIPYSDESLEAMGRASSAEPVMVRTESAPPNTPIEEPRATPVKQPDPIEEAAALLDNSHEEVEATAIEPTKPAAVTESVVPDETAKPLSDSVMTTEYTAPTEEREASQMEVEDKTEVPADSASAIYDLNELSHSINKSLENLAKIQAALEGEEETEVDESVVEAKDKNLLSWAVTQAENRMVQDSSAVIEIHEQFFVRSVDGIIYSADADRTQTNRSTSYIDSEALTGFRLDQASGKRRSIQIHVELVADTFELKLKRDKIRWYQTPAYVEHLGQDHPFYDHLLEELATHRGERIKVVVLHGHAEAIEMEPFEYNPFGRPKQSINRTEVIRIQKIES